MRAVVYSTSGVGAATVSFELYGVDELSASRACHTIFRGMRLLPTLFRSLRLGPVAIHGPPLQ
jgi:hypothetical protein